LWLGVRVFVSDVINGGRFGQLGPLHLALGPKRRVFWYFGWPAGVSVKFFSMKTLRTIHEFCMVNLPYHNEYVKKFLMQIFTAVMGNRVDKCTPLF